MIFNKYLLVLNFENYEISEHKQALHQVHELQINWNISKRHCLLQWRLILFMSNHEYKIIYKYVALLKLPFRSQFKKS